MKTVRSEENGFTLIELSIAMLISVIVMGSVYLMHRSMVKSNQTVEQAASMHQNARAALFFLAQELRLAGADPTGRAYRVGTAPQFIIAEPAAVHFTMDTQDTAGATGGADGLLDAVGENVAYALGDADGDGDTDLVRGDLNGTITVAENIDALNFVYLDQNGTEALTRDDIRSVEVTLVARTAVAPRFHADTDDTVYTNQRDQIIYTPAAGDHHRRIRLATEVKCRNMGLE